MLRIFTNSLISSLAQICYDCGNKAEHNVDIYENDKKSTTYSWNSCEVCWNFNKKVIETYEVKDVLYFIAMRNKDVSVICEACNKTIEQNNFYVQLKQYNYEEKRNCCLNTKCIEYLKLLVC